MSERTRAFFWPFLDEVQSRLVWGAAGSEGLGRTRGYGETDGNSEDIPEGGILGSMTEARFQTPRLLVRDWHLADLPSILEIYGDREAMRFVDGGRPLDLAGVETWFEVTNRNYAERGYGMFAIVERSSGLLVGCGGLVHPGGQVDAEVKYAFLRSRWNLGMASEVVPAVLRHAWERHGIVRVIATSDGAHAASHRVLEKSGMVREGSKAEADGRTTITHAIEFQQVMDQA